jgi:hypothetical protein
MRSNDRSEAVMAQSMVEQHGGRPKTLQPVAKTLAAEAMTYAVSGGAEDK